MEIFKNVKYILLAERALELQLVKINVISLKPRFKLGSAALPRKLTCMWSSSKFLRQAAGHMWFAPKLTSCNCKSLWAKACTSIDLDYHKKDRKTWILGWVKWFYLQVIMLILCTEIRIKTKENNKVMIAEEPTGSKQCEIGSFQKGTTCPCASSGCKVVGCQTIFIFQKLHFSFYVSYCHMKTAPPMNTFDFFKY